MLGIWNTLLEGKADATWVFLQWEGVEAKLKGVELNTFPAGTGTHCRTHHPVTVDHHFCSAGI